jgi:hypothetical protein
MYQITMMIVFVLFLYLLYKKITYIIINKELLKEPKFINPTIIISSITILVLIFFTILSFIEPSFTNTINNLDEGDIYLEEELDTDYGTISIRYNYLTDTLYFKTTDLDKELDITFDDTRYIQLRDIDFNTLETINDGWYEIENTALYTDLTITLYDGNIEVYSEELSILHPYYE